MSFLNRVLEPPTYGYINGDGQFVKLTHSQLFREFWLHVNPFKSKKNWLPFFSWLTTLSLSIPFFIFLFHYFSFKYLVVGFLYSMVGLGTYGTVWFHRYSTHRAFKFRNSIWRFLFRNIVIKVVPEEMYVISHHVHHRFSERPGDPYNVFGGWLYCFLADANHQQVARNLSEHEYKRVCAMLDQTGVHVNSYAQYKKWGSIAHPVYTVLHFTLNWAFWYGVFFLIGGNALATAIFGISVIWAVGIRTFNYEGHAGGRDKRRVGIDFNTADLSINQMWPGIVASEWHNNHHLFPNSARCGFQNYQIDMAWYVIKGMSILGGVTSYRDSKSEFMEKHYLPFKATQITR